MPFHVPTIRAAARLLLAAVLCAAFGASHGARAQGPTLSEMDHESWTARDGAPQAVTALAQAPDGLLWVGTEGGLFSFDGHGFTAFQSPQGEPDLPGGPIESVLAARDGTIWVAFRLSGVACISHGHVTLFTRADKTALHTVQHLQESSDGRIWALRAQQDVIRFGTDGAWHVEPTPLHDDDSIYDIFIDSSDTLWLAQGGRLYRRPLDQSTYFPTEAEADWLFGFAEAPDHSIWVSDSITGGPAHPVGRTQHVDRSGKLLARLPGEDNVRDLRYAPDGSLIIVFNDDRIVRVSAQALADWTAGGAYREEKYDQKDGLSSNAVRAALFDTDGNLWTGGQRGLDRFRTARLIPFLPRGEADASNLCADRTGTLWVIAQGMTTQLYRISSDEAKTFNPNDEIYSIACEPDGDAWILANDGIFTAHADKIVPFPIIPGTSSFDPRQIVAAPNHMLFATVASGGASGIWQYAGGSWTKLPGVGTPVPTTEYVDTHGRLWTGDRDGVIGLPLEGAKRFLSRGDSGLGAIFTILETGYGIVAGGMNGLGVVRDDHIDTLNFADRLSSHGIGGLVESADGDLWLNASRGIVHIPVAELHAALKEPRHAMRTELLTEGDFIGPVELRSGKATAARDAKGNLWFATLNGVFRIDPGQRYSSAHAPIVSIRSITADQRPVVPGAAIGPGVQTLDIQYLGVNLTVPERVTYRYRLDGLDSAWQDSGRRAVAIYPHLPPGTYIFRVIASIDGNTWTMPVSSDPITVLPEFYQTSWFLALCAALSLGLVWLLFTLRLRIVSREISARAEERADERVRISRDLHDTLLQAIQGLLLTFHVAAQKVSPDDESKKMLERALSTADRIIIEGRNRVNSLRSERLTDAELIDALENAGSDLDTGGGTRFHVKREGISATLHAAVADEVFFIAREALTNAFRHARATEITVELTYGRRYFSLSCADDGCGFTSEDEAKPGHWGLKGMRERAQKLGGQLCCRSEAGHGTRIILAVPSYRAYHRYSRLQFLLRALYRPERNPARP